MSDSGEPTAPSFLTAEQRDLLFASPELTSNEYLTALGDAHTERFKRFAGSITANHSGGFSIDAFACRAVSYDPDTYGIDPRTTESLTDLLAESSRQAERLRTIERALQPGTVVLELNQLFPGNLTLAATYTRRDHLGRKDLTISEAAEPRFKYWQDSCLTFETRLKLPGYNLLQSMAHQEMLLQATALTSEELIALDNKKTVTGYHAPDILMIGNDVIHTYAQVLRRAADSSKDRRERGQLRARHSELLGLLHQGEQQGSTEMAKLAQDIAEA